jgi:DNA adenine methylase
LALAAQQRFVSPLRYPGGKGKLSGFVKLFMLQNDLVGRAYVEPYAGGASVALSLLFEEYASHIYINDLNPSVAAFWRVVLDDPDALCSRIERVAVTVEEWKRQRSIQADPLADEIDRAFATFFLNRTSRSGIIGGGIIGGYAQTGRWKIDARFGREDLIRRIRKIARHRRRITITQLDAANFIRDRLPDLEPAFVYLDPPYYVKGEGLYQNFYQHDDHAEIAQLVGGIDDPWIVSYDATDEIRQLYRGYETLEYDLRYSANARYSGTELIVKQDGLAFPPVESPANVHWRLVDAARVARIRP